MEQYCPFGIARFVPAIKFRRSPSGCTKVFFRKIFSVTVKRFSIISLSGWNYKTRKPKASTRMKTKKTKMFQEYILQQIQANTKVTTQSDMRAWNKSFIDQASLIKIAGYWFPSLFAFLWTSTSSRSIKTQKENLANIQPS